MTRTKKIGQAIPDEMSWYEMVWREKSRNYSKEVFERTVLYESTKLNHVFNFAIFFSLNKNLYVNVCDKKQIDDVEMKFGLTASCLNKLS